MSALEGYRLSRQQERLWRLAGTAPARVLRWYFRVRLARALTKDELVDRMQRLAREHEALRTRFVQPPGMLLPLQVIDDARSRDDLIDQAVSVDSLEHCWDAWSQEISSRPLTPPSIALRVVSASDGHALFGAVPAICADAGSIPHLVRGLVDAGNAPAQDESGIQYADYAQWQDELQGSPLATQGRTFWERQEIERFVELALRDPYAEQGSSEFRPASVSIRMPGSAVPALRRAAERCEVSPRTFLLGCWQLLLSVLLDSRRVVTFTVDRSVPSQVEQGIGPYETYLPIVANLLREHAWRDLLQDIDRKVALAAQWREHWHNDALFEGDKRSRAPFLFECHDLERCDGLLEVAGCSELYHLKCSALLRSDGLILQLHHDAARFGREYAARVAEQCVDIIERALRMQGTGRVGDLIEASAGEREQQLAQATAAGRRAETFVDLHRAFEEQAARTPDAAALQFVSQRLTYRELNEAANRLAALLCQRGVQAEDRIGVLLARSPAAIIAILAILKTGAAYVPLDPAYPPRRLALILANCDARMVLTQSALRDSCKGFQGTVLCLDQESDALGRQSGRDLSVNAPADALAYIIYTSGSTGSPKGVMISRRSVHHSTVARSAYYSRPPTRFLVLPSLAFDSSVAPLFWTLTTGGCLVLLEDQAAADPRRIAAIIEQAAVTHILAVPSLYKQVLSQGGEGLRGLHTVIVAGEACSPGLVEEHLATLPGVEFHNEYGPTEATVWSTAWRCDQQVRPRELVPIGRAIAGMQLYVLGRNLQLLPFGAVGELYIGGCSLARGYCDQPHMTALRFVPNPHSQTAGATLYRTGDLVRWLASGDLQYCGRIDQQVKVRGFRIECGEIEAVLMQSPQVESAAVTVRGSTEESAEIVAYIVTATNGGLDRALLRDHLGEHLPNYMMPHKVVTIPALPLGPNGKVDYRQLPEPDDANTGAARYAPPQTPTERQLCDIWQSVLKHSPIGRLDNFFDLGGHSLLAVQIVNRVQRTCGVNLEIGQVFRFKSLGELAAHIDTLQPGTVAPDELELEEVRV